jgi:tetratricopeptide (TPR) repeat protein
MLSCPRCRYSAYRGGFLGEALPEEDEALLAETDALVGDPVEAPRMEPPDEDEGAALRRWLERGEAARGLQLAGRDPFGGERYVLAARCWEFLHDEDPLGAAHFYLRGAWAARGAAQREVERLCGREAATRLQSALDAGKFTDTQKPQLLYLVGELWRRVGEFARAIDCFAQVAPGPEEPEEAEDADSPGALARRQQALAIIKSDVDTRMPESRDD